MDTTKTTVFYELSAFVAYFVATMILYVCTTIISYGFSLNSPQTETSNPLQ
jgi:hypothetical protein